MSQYRGGLIAVTQNSNIVQGSDTEWLSNVEPGDMLLLAGDRFIYSVATVDSDTQLTIVGTYQASTKTGVNYALTRDFTPARSYPLPQPGDIEAIRIFAEAIKRIDADIGSGGGGGGGGGATFLNELLDVTAVNVPAGHVLTKLPDGMYGFQPVSAVNVDGANVGVTGAEIFAGKVGNDLTFRRLRFQNLTFTQSATEITVTGPAPGEVNTGANAGSPGSFGIYKDKAAAALRFFGLRAGAGLSIVPEGDDLVFSATGGGGTTGGEANTTVNLGTGNVKLAAGKSGVDLRFKSIALATNRFTVADGTDTVSVSFKPQPLSESPDVSILNAGAGQILRKDSDGIWKGYLPPAPGISSVSADTAPSLGGDLTLNGRRIIGQAGDRSGMIEKPTNKSYPLILNTSYPLVITQIALRMPSGTLAFRVDIGGLPESNPDGRPAALIEDIIEVLGTTAIPEQAVVVPAGTEVTLTLYDVSADAADLVFSMAYVSA